MSVHHQSHLLTLASAGATYNALTKGMIESYLVAKYAIESNQLSKLRDTLLPKLPSGDIDLVNLQVEQVKILAE
ncbi:hypothetical protein ACMAZD_08575 [Vibrio sp. nBUS_14]|uniref:hypothetical protein n=1 Tax=Vibrio sp. nBUS_14 TaxID=3395321 RepID=UPI003EBFE6C0